MPEIQTENWIIYTPARRVVSGVSDELDGEYTFDARYGPSGTWWLVRSAIPVSCRLMESWMDSGKAKVANA